VRYVDFRQAGQQRVPRRQPVQGARIPGTEHHILPDMVLFLNGLPIAVIECKSPRVKEPLAEAIDQLLRYSEQRGASRGGQRLTCLPTATKFLVATCRNEARFGTHHHAHPQALVSLD
jgi:type I restriction enzyme R subunit